MNVSLDGMKRALTIACNAANVATAGEIVYNHDVSAFTIGRHRVSVRLSALAKSAPRWEVLELLEIPDTQGGGHRIVPRVVGSGSYEDHHAVAKEVALMLVEREIDHALDHMAQSA